MSFEKQDICALFLEDLISYSMDFHQIPWSTPFQLSEKRNTIPILFTEDIGRAVLVITDAYQFRRVVDNSEIESYTMDENSFYNFVSNGACEYLEKSGISSFFHMCAYVVQVSLFCQRKKYFSLQGVLMSGIMSLLVRSLNLDHPKVRLYYQSEAKCMNDARSKRLYRQLQEENAKKANDFISGSTIDGCKTYLQSEYYSHFQNPLLYWRNTANYQRTSSNCLSSQRFLDQGNSNSSNAHFQHSAVFNRHLMKIQTDSERYVLPSVGNLPLISATSSQTIIYPKTTSVVDYYSQFPPPSCIPPNMMNHELENPIQVAYFPYINSSANLSYAQRPPKNWHFPRKNKFYNPSTLTKQPHSSSATTPSQHHVLNANAPSFVHSSIKQNQTSQELSLNASNQVNADPQSLVQSSINQNQQLSQDLGLNVSKQTNPIDLSVVQCSNVEIQQCQELNLNATNQEDSMN